MFRPTGNKLGAIHPELKRPDFPVRFITSSKNSRGFYSSAYNYTISIACLTTFLKL